MYQRTLLELRKSLARRVGIDGSSGDTASADLTTVVLNEFLNDALLETYDLQIERWADYYTHRGSNVTIVAGTDQYGLPTDFYKLRKVELQSGSDWIKLETSDLDAQHLYPSSTARPARYRMMERSIYLMPSPSAAGVFRLYYIPIRTLLVHDADVVTFDVPNEQKLVLAIAWRDCLDRQELDPSPAIDKIERLTKTLRTSADNRDAVEPFYLAPGGPPLSYQNSLDEEWDL